MSLTLLTNLLIQTNGAHSSLLGLSIMNLTIRQTIAFIGVVGLLGRRQQHLSYDQLMSRMPVGASRRLVRLLPLRGNRNIHAVMLYGQKWNNV